MSKEDKLEYYKKLRINEENTMNDGRVARIINYRTAKDIDVLFVENNEIVKNVQYGHFKRGSVTINKTTNRIGETHKLNCGWHGKVINYIENKNIDIIIVESGEIIKGVRYSHLIEGGITPKTYPTVYNVGYLGEECDATIDKNGKTLKSYKSWNRMMERGYSDALKDKHQTYKEVTVCSEWHNYSNFKKWYDDNYYVIDDYRMELDKDIIIKGNKIYSPDTCVFVPQFINAMFTKCDAVRGRYPIGVIKSSNSNKFEVSMSTYWNNKCYLGKFDTPEEAFLVYKQAKEDLIKEVADKYKDKIPKKLYEAMYRYEVEITD